MDRGASAESLRPYLPRLLLRWMGEAPEERSRVLLGSMAFVDISGFTKLSERLARRGKVGAEELTDAIGTCFTRLLAVAYANGGGLIKFGGDALLMWFTGDGHPAKAGNAAVGMRRELREMGVIDCQGVPVRLRMSVGVHSGAFNFFLVGDSHRELIITGPAATETVSMESTAEAGEIVVSRATAVALPPSVLGREKGAGVLLKREPPIPASDQLPPEPVSDEEALLHCVPLAVRERLLAGSADAEHRRATVAFIHFDEMDELIDREGAEVAAQHLDALVGDVQRAVDRNGLTFLGSDIDRDGGKIILVAGAPVSPGNDEERMLLALREILDVDRTIPVRAGVNRGHVFAGDIRPFYRRTYTVMGDAVNLAARLMAKASTGAISSAEGLLELSRTTFDAVELEPFNVKGKAKAVRASRVGAIIRTRHAVEEPDMPLLGRDAELAVLQRELDHARSGAGRLVEIVGEPGLGKSRLIDEVRKHAEDAVSLVTSCEFYESSTPYGAFRGLLRAIVGIAADAGPDEVAKRLHEVLAALSPDLLPWEPLIAIAVDASVPETPETAALEDRFRRPRLNDAIRAMMVGLLRSPTILVFEDVHWLDEASTDLLRHLTKDLSASPWLVCVTRRDVGEGFAAGPDDHCTRVDLKPLDAETAAEMLTAATEDSPFRPDELAALTERAGGNPLFLKELLAAARSSDVASLPDSVESLIMARIDRLAAADRDILRRASVLGRTFSPDLLVAVLNGETPDTETWRRLGEFLGPDEVGNVGFRHALIRDGAYEGLPFRLRRTLHAKVGESIESATAGRSDDQAELLSLHFFYAQRFAEAWRYSLVAAERAKAIYANVEAAEFYQRALEAARKIDDLTPDEAGRVQEALGDVRRVAGDFRAARAAYRAARRTDADRVSEARLSLKEAWVAERLDRYADALRWVRRGTKALVDVSGEEAARQRAELAVWEAVFRQAQGHSREAIRLCERAIGEGEAVGHRRVLARAYHTLDWAYQTLGRLDSGYGEKALQIYEELGDLAGQAISLNNLGIAAFMAGRWDEAIDLYERGRLAREKMGDPVFAADGTYNVAEILSAQGRLDEAEELLRGVLRVWRASGYLSGVAIAMSELGRLAARAGRFEEATESLAQALAEFQHIGEKQTIVETRARIAENLAFQGAAEAALAEARSALETTEARDGTHQASAMLHRIRGYALARRGSNADARRAFEESLDLARGQDALFDVALAARALSRLAGADPESAREFAAESDAIFARLGVRSVVDPPVISGGTSTTVIRLDPPAEVRALG